MKLKALTFIIICLIFSCSNEKVEMEDEVVEDVEEIEVVIYPECVQAIINEILEANLYSQAKIKKYFSNGEVIYVTNLILGIDAIGTTFINENCEKICSGSTGIAGIFENDCIEEFLDSLVFQEVLWEYPS